jgi:hypothetical protein
MKRVMLSIVIPLLVMLVSVLPVNAGLTYCKSDPIIQLNGTLVDISVAIPLKYVPLVNGPVSYEIQTPKSTVRELILSDAGYNGHGITVTFTDGGIEKNGWIPTKIKVRVPIDKSQLDVDEVVPAKLSVLPDNGSLVVAEGTSDLTQIELLIQGR